MMESPSTLRFFRGRGCDFPNHWSLGRVSGNGCRKPTGLRRPCSARKPHWKEILRQRLRPCVAGRITSKPTLIIREERGFQIHGQSRN